MVEAEVEAQPATGQRCAAKATRSRSSRVAPGRDGMPTALASSSLYESASLFGAGQTGGARRINEGESLPRAPELPEQEPREREVSGRVMNGSVARPGWQRATEGSRAFRKPLGQAGTHA